MSLGAISKPHGIRGEVRVHRFNPDSKLLLEQPSVWLLRDGGPAEARRVEAARAHGPAVLLKLEGVESRDAAEALRGLEVAVPREALPPADDDEYYHVDLVGLRVVTADGEAVGEVVEVLSYPASDCLLVRGAGLDREVPLLRPYVEDIDLEAGVVTAAFLDDLQARRSRA